MQQNLIQSDMQKYFRCKAWRLKAEGKRERFFRRSQQSRYWNLRGWRDSTSVWRLQFGRPVRVAVTTLRLVGEADIQLRRHSLHLILLEIESSDSVKSLRWVFKVDSWNLHRLSSLREFTIAFWIPQNNDSYTGWKITVFKSKKLRITRTEFLRNAQLLWLVNFLT